jgi:hypothetical protein
MPDEVTLPEAPQTVAELLPYLPLPYAYAVQWGLVFDAALADRLAEVQAENPSQHYARPTLLTNGSYLLCGDLLSEVGPGGLYSQGFAQLDAARFDEILVVPWEDAVDLIPAPMLPV